MLEISKCTFVGAGLDLMDSTIEWTETNFPRAQHPAIDTLVTGMVLDSETFSILFANCVPFFQLFKILAPGIVTFMSEYNE